MDAVVEAIIHTVPGAVLTVVRVVAIFLFSLGVVYILGRMLEILRGYRVKNTIAVGCMLGASYVSVIVYDGPFMLHPYDLYVRVALYTSVAAILYVLIGFDLYDRFNAWSDRKFAKPRKLPVKRNTRRPK